MEALVEVGLGEFADLPPHVLSHGMRKRAALAGVLAMRPRLLLLDEPTAGLDRRSEEDLLELLARLAAEGTTVILSTHDLELASEWAARSLVLVDGQLAYDGGAAALMEDGEMLVACGLRRRRGEGCFRSR